MLEMKERNQFSVPAAQLMRTTNVFGKPIARECGDFLQRSWLFKEMGRAWKNLQFHFAAHPIPRLLVYLDDDVVVAADNEEGWCLHFWQSFTRQIRTPAARYHRADILRNIDRRDQGRCAARAGAKIANPQIACVLVLLCPFCSVNEAFRQQMDVEPKRASLHVNCVLLLREQIKKQRREPGLIECTRHKLIPRTVAAATTAVRKKSESARVFRNIQTSGENCAPGANFHFVHLLFPLLFLVFPLYLRPLWLSCRAKSRHLQLLSLRIRDSCTAVGITKWHN